MPTDQAMALNEHDPSGPSAAPDELSEADRLAWRVQQVILQAEHALAQGDVAAYAAALAQCDDIDHDSRRHHARIKSIDRGFLPRPGASQTQIATTILASLRALTGWLEGNPREPSLAAYAGVLCVELGLYREGEELLRASAALCPELPEIDQAIRTATGRRQARAKVKGLPVTVTAALPRLRERLAAIAPRVVPAEGMRVSLCMIVRDEEEMLPRCLEAVKAGVDEMIIVDTGSRDRTVEIAESFGATVLHFTWTGNFGEARNVGLEAATGDWVLILDADEIFVADDALALRPLLGRTWREAFFVEEINHLGDLDDGTSAKHQALRLLRNRPEYRFSGAVHEQMAQHLPGYLPDRLEHTDIRLDHYGYLGTVRIDREKTGRNLELLQGQLSDGEDTAFLHFNLGSEYAGIDEEKALEHFRRAWELAVADPRATEYGFVPSLSSRFVRALRGDRDYEAMEEAATQIHAWFPGFTDVFFEQSIAALEQDDLARSRELAEHCLSLGDAPAKYSSTVGCGTYLAQLRLAQLDIHAGNEAAAIERMREVRREYPTYYGMIDPFVSVLLNNGHTPEQIFDEVTEGGLSPSGWFMVAVNFQERGHLTEAERAFKTALELRPTFDAVHVALADSLLVQGRVEEAALEAEQVPADDPRVGAAAVRTALFARLAMEPGESGEATLAAQRSALLQQLELTDLPDPDKAVLRAWAARRAGDRSPAVGLDRSSIDHMTPILDALLRLAAGDAFADLLELLPDTGIDRRTQHEVVGTLLLRRGLSELAAEEWIAAVNESGPDAAAYAGLAEAARLQGLEDDARTLAAEALDLEPEQPLATRVLAAIAA
ncbi:MAG: glycosyltransferase [Solirubrobacteraceae bacterium]|nr:glycosyltransferase [Solirubrobacteraceae bacterium]